MKILHVPPGFYPRVGGEENLILGWAREQVRAGHTVRVVAPEDGAPHVREVDGIRVSRVRTLLHLATANITPALPLKLLFAPADVVHSHYPMPWNADWGVWIGRLRRKPVVLTYCNDLGGSGLKGLFGLVYNNTVLRLTLRLAHQVIAISPAYPRLSPHLRRHQHKTVVIQPGVDTEYFRPLDLEREPSTIFFVGALGAHHRYKGLEPLLRAVALVRETVPEVKLVVAGKGPEDNVFSRLATDLGLRANVEFLGFAPDEQVREWYNRCTVFAMPSLSWRQEGFGIVAMEAMACGAATIVSSVVGAVDSIREYDAGIVTEPGDHKQIAQVLLELFTDPQRRADLGRRGRQLVEDRYTWEHVGWQTMDLYERLLKHGGKRP